MPSPPPIGPLESQVLGLLGRDPQSVSAIQEKLRRGGHELAYTTVMTVLARLHAKGVVTRRKAGNRYEYLCGSGAERLREGVLVRWKRRLFSNDRLRPVLALLDGDDPLSKEELRVLRDAIDARLGKGKSGG